MPLYDSIADNLRGIPSFASCFIHLHSMLCDMAPVNKQVHVIVINKEGKDKAFSCWCGKQAQWYIRMTPESKTTPTEGRNDS